MIKSILSDTKIKGVVKLELSIDGPEDTILYELHAVIKNYYLMKKAKRLCML